MIEFTELLHADYPTPANMAGAWLQASSLVMFWGARGIGKTFVLTTIMMGIAAGQPVLGFPIKEQAKVLVIDGEMPLFELQKRARALQIGHEIPEEKLKNQMFYYTSEEFPKGTCDISQKSGQLQVDARIKEVDPVLIVLDNLSALITSGDPNAADSWNGVVGWLVKLRNAGHCVLLVDHSGKDVVRGPRGTGRKEDAMDTAVSLNLKQHFKKGKEPGPERVWKFTKNRRFVLPNPGCPDNFEIEITDLPNGGVLVENVTASMEEEVRKAQVEQPHRPYHRARKRPVR